MAVKEEVEIKLERDGANIRLSIRTRLKGWEKDSWIRNLDVITKKLTIVGEDIIEKI